MNTVLFVETPPPPPADEDFSHLLAGIRIPPQPEVVDTFGKLLEAGECNVGVLAKVLNQDPGIVGLLYKAVASPVYRRHQPFASVERILQVVGLRQTYNLVRAAALASLTDLQRNRALCEAVWARGRAIAQFAMVIADERISVCNIFPDQAYMAGIFHDVGILLLTQRFPEYGESMHLAPGHWADVKEEDRRFNADHAVVGYVVARHWHLPEFIAEAIRYHHDIRELGYHASRTMVAILQLATELYHRDLRTVYPEWEAIQHEVLDELGLNADALPEFADIVAERVAAQENEANA